VKVLEELSTPGLKKEESIVSAKLQREQSSTIKLQRVESEISTDTQVKDLLLGNQQG